VLRALNKIVNSLSYETLLLVLMLLLFLVLGSARSLRSRWSWC